MKAWCSAHVRACAGAFSRLASSPLANLLNITVIGIALALPLALYLLLANLQSLANERAPEPEISLFLALDATAADARTLEQRLRKHSGVASVRFVPRAQALERLKSRAGLGEVAAGLSQNPLPDAFIVTAADRRAAALENLRAELAALPKIAEAHVDAAWAQRLESLIRFGRTAALALALALGTALIAITFNTIRLQILTQHAEIEVARLLGATNAWVSRPFLYFGALIGALGGCLAWLLTALVLLAANRQLEALAALYDLPLTLTHLNAEQTGVALFLAMSLGWLGAWLSVRRHLGNAE